MDKRGNISAWNNYLRIIQIKGFFLLSIIESLIRDSIFMTQIHSYPPFSHVLYINLNLFLSILPLIVFFYTSQSFFSYWDVSVYIELKGTGLWYLKVLSIPYLSYKAANWGVGGPSDETAKIEVPCHKCFGTIKDSPSSKTKQRPIFYSLLSLWNIFGCMERQAVSSKLDCLPLISWRSARKFACNHRQSTSLKCLLMSETRTWTPNPQCLLPLPFP